MKKNQTMILVHLCIAFAIPFLASFATARTIVADEEEIYFHKAGGAWQQAVWSSVRMDDSTFEIIRLEVAGGELTILLLPDALRPQSIASLKGGDEDDEDDHEVDPDPTFAATSTWTAQASLNGGDDDEDDHEVDPDPTDSDRAHQRTRRLRFETSSDLNDTKTRRELLEWLLNEIDLMSQENHFQRIN